MQVLHFTIQKLKLKKFSFGFLRFGFLSQTFFFKDMKKVIYIVLSLFLYSCSTNDTRTNLNLNKIESNYTKGFLENISPEKLLNLIRYDKNVFIVDIRKQGKTLITCKLIGRFHHIDESLITENPDILPDKQTIVLLSKDGTQGNILGKFLITKKNITVYNLKGGMNAYWQWRENLIRKKMNIFDQEINVLDLYSEDFGC